MELIGLDEKIYKIDLTKYLTNARAPTRPMSKPMMRAISLVTKMFPSDPFCTEIYLPGASYKLYLDILIPSKNLALEPGGVRVHQKFNTLYHKDKSRFYRTQARDREKRELLEKNNIILIDLFDNESDSVWINKIRQGLLGNSNA